ncbi:Uncharacterised protein [uncultured archaeon]|nr:Uncharacterised protein [uncultured archaeon]
MTTSGASPTGWWRWLQKCSSASPQAGNRLKFTTMIGSRLLLLIPMAFCLYLLFDSQDRYVRLAAIIALIVLEQSRQWLMLSSMRSLAKGNKP